MTFKLNDIVIYPSPSLRGRTRRIESHFPKEIMPPWENKKTKWNGFQTLFHATTVCALHKHPCVIVDVGPTPYLMGYGNTFCNNYKVYEISRLRKFSIPVDYTVTCWQPGIRLMHFMKRPQGELYELLENIYITEIKEILVRHIDLHEDEIVVFDASQVVDLTKLITLGSDSRINFPINVERNAFTAPVDFDESLKDSNVTPKVKIFVTSVNKIHSDLKLGCTMLHECVHRIHFLRALAMIKIWRQSKTRLNFLQWIVIEAKKEKKKRWFTKTDLLVIEISLDTTVDDKKTKVSEPMELTNVFGLKDFKLIQSSELLHMYPYLEVFKISTWLSVKHRKSNIFEVIMSSLHTLDDCYGVNAPSNWVTARTGHAIVGEEICNEVVKVLLSLNLSKKLKDEIGESVKHDSENRHPGSIMGSLSQNPGALLKILHEKLIQAM